MPRPPGKGRNSYCPQKQLAEELETQIGTPVYTNFVTAQIAQRSKRECLSKNSKRALLSIAPFLGKIYSKFGDDRSVRLLVKVEAPTLLSEIPDLVGLKSHTRVDVWSSQRFMEQNSLISIYGSHGRQNGAWSTKSQLYFAVPTTTRILHRNGKDCGWILKTQIDTDSHNKNEHGLQFHWRSIYDGRLGTARSKKNSKTAQLNSTSNSLKTVRYITSLPKNMKLLR